MVGLRVAWFWNASVDQFHLDKVSSPAGEVSWSCGGTGWRCGAPQGPSNWKVLEVQGRQVMFVCSRAWGVSVVVVFVRARVGFCLVGVVSGLCGVVWLSCLCFRACVCVCACRV